MRHGACLILLLSLVAGPLVGQIATSAGENKDSLTLKFSGEMARIVRLVDSAPGGEILGAYPDIKRISEVNRTPISPLGMEVWIAFRGRAELYQGSLSRIGVRFDDDHYINVGNFSQAFVPFTSLRALAEIPDVLHVDLPPTGVPSTVISEGLGRVSAHNLLDHGFRGSGVKIAILDVGFAGYQDLLGTELPSSVTAVSYYDSITGEGDITSGDMVMGIHGTACAEIVHGS